MTELEPTETLYPKRPRKKRDRSHLRWHVRYEDMVYEGGSSSWTGYHRTRASARIAAWWNQNVASYGGRVTLTDQANGSTS